MRKFVPVVAVLGCVLVAGGVIGAGGQEPVTVDGLAGDWTGSEYWYTDPQGDVERVNKGQPFAPLPEDDLLSYGFREDGTNFYAMLKPGRMPAPGMRYHYRIQALLKVNGRWKQVFAVRWASRESGGNGLELRNLQTWKDLPEQPVPGALFAGRECFEARIPLAALKGLPVRTRIEPAIWHHFRNACDGGSLQLLDISRQTVRYMLDLRPLPDRPPQITVHYTGFTADRACLQFGDKPVNTAPGIRIGRYSARTAGGGFLSTALLGNRLVVANGTVRDFTVQYELPVNQTASDRGKGFFDFYNTVCYLGNVGWTFLRDNENTSRSHAFTVVAPAGWTTVTPWGVGNEPSGIRDSNRFYEATYVSGNVEFREENIGGTVERIVLDRRFSADERRQLFENGFRIYRFVKTGFGAPGPPVHLSVFVKALEDGYWQHGNESGPSHAEPIRSLRFAWDVQEHRVFHTYNCFPPTGLSWTSTWLEEGPNMYCSELVLMHLRQVDPFRKLRSIYRDKYLPGRARYDISLAGNTRDRSNWEREEYLTYYKGTLLAFLLDREIRLASKRKGTIGEVHRRLYDRYGNRNGRITDVEFIRYCSTVAGKDLSPFFTRYVYGTAALPLDVLLADPDMDGLCTAVEELLGTDPLKKDTDGDGIDDMQAYLTGKVTLDRW